MSNISLPEPVDAKAAHDNERIAKTGYVNDPKTASYFWRVVLPNGDVVNEYGACDCSDDKIDASGHLHRISEWPGAPKPVSGAPMFSATTDFQAYDLYAIPETLDHQNLPELKVRVEPGDQIIWGHRVRTHRSQGVNAHEDTMVFGVKKLSGEELVTSVYPDGTKVEHDSFEAADKHVNDATHISSN